MPPRQPPEHWWIILLRHFTTFCAIVGILWWIGSPRVEAFIHDVVNDRISRVELRLDRMLERLNKIDIQLDRIEKKENG